MIAAIVQARMGSTRLPGKVMKDLLGRPLLWHLINRLRKAQLLQEIVIATSKEEKDKPIADFAHENRIRCYRGSELDLADRIYQAAKLFEADPIVRITGDCPLTDPAVVDKVVQYYLKNRAKLDYVSNVDPRTYPIGLDVEVFSFEALEKLWREIKAQGAILDSFLRFFQKTGKFRTGNVKNDQDLSSLRWTVDYPEDLEFVTEIFRRLGKNERIFLTRDILDLLAQEPNLAEINRQHARPP